MKKLVKLLGTVSVVTILFVGCGGSKAEPAKDGGSGSIAIKNFKEKDVKTAIVKAGESMGIRMLPVRRGVVMGEKFTGDGATVLEVHYNKNSFKVADVSSDKYKDSSLADNLANKIHTLLVK